MASKIKLSNANGKIVTIENNDSNMSDVTLNGASITKKVDTLANMRSMNELPETVWCSGYSIENDGAFGSHFYRLKGLKTAETDNGGTVIVVSVGGSDYVYELQYDGAVNVKWFGAVGDGVTDDTNAFVLAMLCDRLVEVPEGVHMVTGLTLRPEVKLIGAMSQDGWSRNNNYTQGSVIKLIDNSNVPVITLPTATANSGAHNLTIDGNKDNQTSFMSHGIRCNFGVQRSTGQTWKGLRVVNTKGFGGYFEGGPCQITNCFFMSGAFINRVSDLKIEGCDFDGTDGYHPSLWINECSSSNISNSFVWGWGEVSGGVQLTKQSKIVIDLATNHFTASGGWMEDDQPIVFLSAPTYPTCGSANYNRFGTWFLQREADGWSLWSRPFDNENRQKMEFTTAPTDVYIGWGHEEACLINNTTGAGVSSMRFAGSQVEALRLFKVNSSAFNGIRTWGMNYRNAINTAAVKIIDSNNNTFSGSILGERVGFTPKIPHSVQFIDMDGTCGRNVIGSDCVLQNVVGSVIVEDSTKKNTYETRNQIFATISPDEDTNRVTSPHYYLEPGKQCYIGRQDYTLLPANTNTNVILYGILNTGISKPTSSSLMMITTTGGLYNFKGQFRIAGHDATLRAVKLSILIGSNIRSVYCLNRASTATDSRGFTVPFDFNYVDTGVQGGKIITFKLYTEGGGSSMTLDATDEYSSVSVTKLADLPQET